MSKAAIWLSMLLMLVSLPASADCINDLRDKTYPESDRHLEQVQSLLETWCELRNGDASSLSKITIKDNYFNASHISRSNEIVFGKDLLPYTNSFPFILAHEAAHEELQHHKRRMAWWWGAIFTIVLTLGVPIYYWRKLGSKKLVLLTIIPLSLHYIYSIEYFNRYIEDEHEADLHAVQILQVRNFDVYASITAFLNAFDEGEPSFWKNYIWPYPGIVGGGNPHPSKLARIQRLSEFVPGYQPK
jgi:hypothetical protein